MNPEEPYRPGSAVPANAELRFKTGTRVPEGATPAGVVEECLRIQDRCGAATIDASAREVISHRDDYPNLWAFCPGTDEEAWSIAVKDAIRKAYKSVVVIRSQPGDRPPTEIRVLHAPPADSGEREYKTLWEIRENPKDLRRLVTDLRQEADSYSRKMHNVLAEIEEAL